MVEPRVVLNAPSWVRRGWIAILVYLVTMGLITSYGFWRTQNNQNDLNALIERRTAESCVRQWDTRDEIIAAITIPAEAIIESATDPDPEAVERFRMNIDRRVAEAFPDPECDLDAAEAYMART